MFAINSTPLMHWNSSYTHISSSARASAIVVLMVSRVESPPVLSLTMTRADGVAGEVEGVGAAGEAEDTRLWRQRIGMG